ncbi:hypothetical protein V3851_22240 [Paenibacillus sp. M1]|uniref:Zn-finger containing protein n=1 Tax=Paenibacillus haidiansis TaxID=1574488 RepID=A0ABU7VXQ1_9BACL
MKERLRQFMMGRYGMDHYGRFLYIASIVCLILGMFLSPLLTLLAFALLIYQYFRMFSRNFYKRGQENNAYLAIRHRITGWFRTKKQQVAQRKTHRFYKCPSCKQTLRVPKGKGKISITCSKCHTQFVRKS